MTELPERLPKPRGIKAAFRQRYLDVLVSIYIYNEHRGYTALDRVLDAVERRCPDNADFIDAVRVHRADERKHYLMFKRWFERQGRMPLALGSGFGHIDHFIRMGFRCSIDDLDAQAVVDDGDAFEKLCRIVILTEQRGLAQVAILLDNAMVRSDPILPRIFRVIEKDEPRHFLPYVAWLEAQKRPLSYWNERMADWFIHKLLLLVKLPTLFFTPRAARLSQWPDTGEPA